MAGAGASSSDLQILNRWRLRPCGSSSPHSKQLRNFVFKLLPPPHLWVVPLIVIFDCFDWSLLVLVWFDFLGIIAVGYCGRENSLYGIGIGIGYGKKIDPEPGRCRRTDGKKWRCAKEAYPDSKYCERHMNRGRSRSRKHVESHPLTTSSPSLSTATTSVSPLTQSLPLKYNTFASASSTAAPSVNPNQSQFQLDSIPYAIPTKPYSRYSLPLANISFLLLYRDWHNWIVLYKCCCWCSLFLAILGSWVLFLYISAVVMSILLGVDFHECFAVCNL